MRNLSLLYRVQRSFDVVSPRLMIQCEIMRSLSIVYDGSVVKSLNSDTGEVKELMAQEDVIAMEYTHLNDSLCLATKSGEIIQYSLNNETFEVVGIVGDGIEAMKWSPDQELVVFVTKSQNVILMFSTFDVLCESSLNEKAAQEFITVGWGKKETQFHGSVGKDGRKKEIESKLELAKASTDHLDKSVSCCWRGDGEFFAVNHVGANGRMFKVFNKDGGLQYTSELCANLQVPIAWRPSGLWIAKPEVLPTKYVVTLFERNGLKHSELVLPFTAEEEVKNLSWSADSEIFLIETARRLYFYTICNYHWYLKHTIELSEEVLYTWSQDYIEHKVLHLITSSGVYSKLNFGFQVTSSSGDESIVSVIDGKKLLLTNFRSQMVPPPMASLEVELETPVNVVGWLQSPGGEFDENSFVTLNGSNVLRFFRCILSGKKLAGVEKVKEIELGGETYTNLLWINSKFILLIKASSVFLFSIESGLVEEFSVEEVIGSVAAVTQNEFVLQLMDGQLLHFSISPQISLIKSLESFPEFCESFIVRNSSVFGLKNIKKKLFMNGKELATEVTSFALTPDYEHLLYTTIGELKFMDTQQQIVDTRRVERGSKIVCLVKDKSQVIFQLPRGNLETVSPRILSLKIVKKFLERREYREAFDMLRKERINLNLIVDVDPSKFINDLSTFVNQIDNTQWLNLFLTELKDEDVTKTMYKFCSSVGDSIDNKVIVLCKKFLEIFEASDKQKFLLPLITCHVKMQDIETALQVIWDLHRSGTSADDALKYLLYLIDINSLYNVALGMYDFQLVLYVAQRSQKDPKEFVPFLNELSKLDTNYAKFKIDCHLKRYAKAVKSIAECPDKFEECVELVKKQNLYEPAMQAYREKDEESYRRICVLFGDHLREKGKLLDASLMYERGGDFQQAMAGARNILDWRRCVKLAEKCGIKGVEEKICVSLQDAGRFKEASELVRRFAPGDTRKLVEVLVKGRLYSEAILEADDELIKDLVKPQLHQHLTEAIKSVEDDRTLYLDQKHRLLSLREEKMRKILNPPDDEDETFSDTSSMNSQSSKNTARTFRSSKTKRKHERKLMNLKEGNKFEDIALLDAIWKLVAKISGQENQNGVKELLQSAVELGLDEEGKKLQKSFKDLLLLLKHSMDEIWIPEMLTAGKYPESEEEMMQINLDSGISSKMSYELIKPEQRFKPKLNVIDFEMELYRDASKKSSES